MTEPPAGFGSLLRRLRRDTGLTQEELAEAAALSMRAVAEGQCTGSGRADHAAP